MTRPLSSPSDLIEAWRASVRESRDERVQAILGRLSDREREVIREAAVMGFVQGILHVGGLHTTVLPRDSEMLWRTLDGIASQPDIYPALSGWTPEVE